MNLPTNKIIFLSDVPSDIKVDMTSGWRHHYFDGGITELSTFIKLIGDEKIYLLIPLFSRSKSLENATLNLSEPFLVNNKILGKLKLEHVIEKAIFLTPKVYCLL